MSIVAIVFAFLTTGPWPLIPELRLLRRPLRCLQRIDRRGTGKSTTLSGRLLRFGNHDVSALRPGNTAFDHQQVLVLVDAEHAQVAGRHLLMSHVSRHPHAFENTRWKRGRPNRTSDLKHRTVRLRTATEVMPFHNTLKTFALAHSDDIDELLAFKNLDQHAVADFHCAVAV